MSLYIQLLHISLINRVKFDLVPFYLKGFNLESFRHEIINLFDNKAFYDFQIGIIYYVHLVDTNGKVFSVVPFKLLSVNDKEELIVGCYNEIVIDLGKYSAIRKYIKRILIYISVDQVNEIKFEYLYDYLTKRLIDLDKMNQDLTIDNLFSGYD